jgi:hypothetical protein
MPPALSQAAARSTLAATTELMGGVVIVVGGGAANNLAGAGGAAASFTSNNVASPEVVDGLSGGGLTESPASARGAAFTSSDKAPAHGLVADRYGGAANSCSYPTALSDLTDDLIEEILLRLSPEEQGCRERISVN